MIDLLYLLVKYGYYANLDDISSLMPLLLSSLDGMNDQPSIQASKDETDDFKKVQHVWIINSYITFLAGWSFQGHRRK